MTVLDRALVYGPELTDRLHHIDPRESEAPAPVLPSWDDLAPFIDELDSQDRDVFELARLGVQRTEIATLKGLSQPGVSVAIQRIGERLGHFRRLDALGLTPALLRGDLGRVLGDRTARLLAATLEHGIVSRAAKAVGIGHSTAWKHWNRGLRLVEGLAAEDPGRWGAHHATLQELDRARMPRQRFHVVKVTARRDRLDAQEQDWLCCYLDDGVENNVGVTRVVLEAAAAGARVDDRDALLVRRYLDARRAERAWECLDDAEAGVEAGVGAGPHRAWIVGRLVRAARIAGELGGTEGERIVERVGAIRRRIC